MRDPTQQTYDQLRAAYDFFNARLFDGSLPPALLTMQRKANTRGYFARERFGARDGSQITDEIALNPKHFKKRSTEATLSTLVHEMVHLQQFHHGTPSRRGYHNKEWGDLMRAVGLIPSDTGHPGGKTVGQRVSHYVEAGGRFERAVADLMQRGDTVPFVDLWDDDGKAKKKAESKTKYTCPGCSLNAWAKPDSRLTCSDCGVPMNPPRT